MTKRIAAVLAEYGLDVRGEGHSHNVPIHADEFASNWDLSTAWAMAAAMMLLDDAGFDPRRMPIAGYAQYPPTARNDTAEGRRANRRYCGGVCFPVSSSEGPVAPGRC
jgi:chemotaxis protein MotB